MKSLMSNQLQYEWWLDESQAKNIHSYLLDRELQTETCTLQSPQISYRPYFLDFLDNACDQFEFCKSVKHLAAYMLDIFMDSHYITENHWQLVVLSCLIIAAKVDESNYLIPQMSDFKTFLGDRYDLSQFIEMELSIMSFLKWELLIPTVITFVDYYTIYAIATTDYYDNSPIDQFAQASVYTTNYIDYFVDVSLRELCFRQFRCSLVAASCIAATRVCLLLTPAWPQRLRSITNYNMSDLKDCLLMMIKILEMDEMTSKSQNLNVSDDSEQLAQMTSSDYGSCSSTDSSPSKP